MQLGAKYLRGEGVRADNALAYRWYLRAAELNNPIAQHKVIALLFFFFRHLAYFLSKDQIIKNDKVWADEDKKVCSIGGRKNCPG